MVTTLSVNDTYFSTLTPILKPPWHVSTIIQCFDHCFSRLVALRRVPYMNTIPSAITQSIRCNCSTLTAVSKLKCVHNISMHPSYVSLPREKFTWRCLSHNLKVANALSRKVCVMLIFKSLSDTKRICNGSCARVLRRESSNLKSHGSIKGSQ